MRDFIKFRENLLKARLEFKGPQPTLEESRSGVFMKEFYEVSDGVKVKENTIAGIEVLDITPQKITSDYYVIYIHGGGYSLGDPSSETSYPTEFMKQLEAKGISIRYRLSPEHPFPNGLDDVLTVYKEVIKTIDPKKVILIGCSAGGGLTVSTCLKMLEDNIHVPRVIVLLSAWLDLKGELPSYTENRAIDALLNYDFVSEKANEYAEGNLNHPLLNPLTYDLSGFPETFAQVGGHEMLRDDSVYFTERLTKFGVKNKLDLFEDGFHSWQLFNNHMTESQTSLLNAVNYIKNIK